MSCNIDAPLSGVLSQMGDDDESITVGAPRQIIYFWQLLPLGIQATVASADRHTENLSQSHLHLRFVRDAVVEKLKGTLPTDLQSNSNHMLLLIDNTKRPAFTLHPGVAKT